jgi:hypothetical protein
MKIKALSLYILGLFIATAFSLSATDKPPAVSSSKPNIIIFLADDLGYADVGFNGCEDIPTPNIDSIAANGVKFTDGYANHPVCSPSRAGLLTVIPFCYPNKK